MMIPGTQQNSWSYDEDFNLKIDFCIWVLKVDGLHVPPFDKHSEGNRVLTNLGLEAEAWHSWLLKVVATQDPYFLDTGTREEYIAWAESDLAVLQKAKSLGKLNIDEYEYQRRENKIIARIQKYHLAAEIADPFCRSCDPPGIWMGNSEVGKILWDLWQSYQEMWEEKNTLWVEEYIEDQEKREQMSGINQFWHSLIEAGSSFFDRKRHRKYQLYKKLKQYGNCLDTLNIYEVDYPFPVEYLVPPGSIIISVAKGERDTDTYSQRVLQATKNLANLTN